MKVEPFEAIFAVQLETQNCIMLKCDSDLVKRSCIDELEGHVVTAEYELPLTFSVDACTIKVTGELHYSSEDSEYKRLKFVVLETY